MLDESDLSESDSSDRELQEAFAKKLLKPGLNIVEQAPKQPTNNINGIYEKLQVFKSTLPWLENLDCICEQAPLAPELQSQIFQQEQKKQSGDDAILNDFKREMMFHRQAQAAVLEMVPKLVKLGLKTKRPDDYFAEMAKTDQHMQKVRENLMKKQHQQKMRENVQQLRIKQKERKSLQVVNKQQRKSDKKEMSDEVKKKMKGKNRGRDVVALRKRRDDKFGFGGKKRGSKTNTKESAADMNEYKRPSKFKGKPGPNNKNNKQKGRLGKNRRMKNKNTKGKKFK